jgi:hypothetical protein
VNETEVVELILRALGVLGPMIAAWINGSDDPEVLRLVEILPGDIRTELELERQRRLLEADLRAKEAGRG